MTKSALTAFPLILLAVTVLTPAKASAQDAILAEMYGRGVHAYYAGDTTTALRFLSMAIDNGTQDPRAYYFRGMVADSLGNAIDAEADWKKGAEMEASGQVVGSIGRSLARFQGAARLKLEGIRQEARLGALAAKAARSKARYGEIKAAEARVLRQPPSPAAQPPAAAVTPPPAAAAGTDDPFVDDMAGGAPTVQSDDALAGAMEDPFAGDASIPAADVPPNEAGDPFGAPAAGGDPFGTPPAGDSDPFGTPPAGDSDPFGGGGAEMSDPFGGDPFGG